jgi:O-methyltransferase
MRLSLAIVTKNSARYVERLLQTGRAIADEVVIAVDASSVDLTEDVCRPYADKLFRIEPIGYIERALTWLNAQCTGDWILRVDDDELLSAQFVEALPRLMQDREITHYWILRRWVYGAGRDRWITQRPWSVDWQLRLFRNIPSIVNVPELLHTSYEVQGATRFLRQGSLYHLDLVLQSDTQRMQKVQRYERLSPGRSRAEYYTLPDPGILSTLPLPSDDLPYEAASAPDPTAGGPPIVNVSLAEIRRAAMRECEYGPELFRASLVCTDYLPVMTVGETYRVVIDVRNDSQVAWAAGERGVPRVRVAYHWFHENGEIYEHEGMRTDLPHTLQPGETTRFWATVFAPEEAGQFILRWDFVIELVSWFSAHGWQGPETEVRVVEPPDVTFSSAASPRELHELGPLLDRVRPYSMVPEFRLIQLARQVRTVLEANVRGDFVECGTWRGGAAFLMADLLREAGVQGRRVWLFDSFEGLPPADQIDGQRALDYSRDPDPAWDNCRASLEDVQRTASRLGLADHTVLVKGWFDETLPAHSERIGPIAILRIDADWYAGVRRCLDELYDQVAPGGLVIVDDYSDWEGCCIAVHEFLGERRLSHRLIAAGDVAFFWKS